MKTYYLTNTEQIAEYKLAEFLHSDRVFGVDTETTGLNPKKHKIRLIQIATEEVCFVIDMFKVKSETLLNLLRLFFKNESKLKVFHNAAFDEGMLLGNYGIEVYSIFDTQIASKLIHAGSKTDANSLQAACYNFLSLSLPKDEQMSDWKRENLTEKQVKYSAYDALVVLPLRKVLIEHIVKMNLLETTQIEFDAVLPVRLMSNCGMKMDTDKWIANTQKSKKELDELVKEILQFSVKPTINLNSAAQKKALLEENNVFVPSTGKNVLKEYKHVPLVKMLLEYSFLSKRVTTYGDTMLKFINQETKRIHPNFKQMGAYTGRMSCTEPNFQNFPHTEDVRSCFIAEKEKVLITADYSQLELRILAEISNEPLLIKAFLNGDDVHTQTTQMIYEKTDVSDEERRIGKTINFGQVYGIGEEAFSEMFGVPIELVRIFMVKFRQRYKVLTAWLKSQTNMIKDYGYTCSASGRLVNLKKAMGVDDSPYNVVKNYPIQSTNADIIKILLFEIMPLLKKYDAQLVNCVHDEVVVEIDRNTAKEFSEKLVAEMILAGQRYIKKVPVTVSCAIKEHWSK
jgi:DNA polymerase I